MVDPTPNLPDPPVTERDWGRWLDHLTAEAAGQLRKNGEVLVDFVVFPRDGEILRLRAPDQGDPETVVQFVKLFAVAHDARGVFCVLLMATPDSDEDASSSDELASELSEYRSNGAPESKSNGAPESKSNGAPERGTSPESKSNGAPEHDAASGASEGDASEPEGVPTQRVVALLTFIAFYDEADELQELINRSDVTVGDDELPLIGEPRRIVGEDGPLTDVLVETRPDPEQVREARAALDSWKKLPS